MTDKQIIIDGCDVSGCVFYGFSNLNNHLCTSKEFSKIDCTYCNDNPNCYYKQLKRKEQECEELKKDVIEALKLVEITSTHNTFQETKINRLSKTLTEIKEIAEDLITITDEYYNCYHKDECDKCLLGIDGNCQYIKVKQILQKISEVE